jgi:NAD(P)-dependent dehydrogenase (short-subunit alcohol dehydrogenase family)
MSATPRVFVTGCSSGFGLGLARAFREQGWDVIAGLRDPARAPRELDAVRIVALDLADEAQVLAAAGGIDRLDCLVNNAGYALTGPFASYSLEDMRRQMAVNVIGPALLTQRLLPALRAAGGRVINVSSVAGEAGMPMNALYCAAKHAVEGLSEALRHELAPHGVQVALVEPGGFRTSFGSNMQWGSQPVPPGGIEAGQLAGYRAMRERLLARPGRDPAAVVDAIVALARAPVMPFRTRVGADAWLLHRLKRWLPERLALALIGSLFRRRMTVGKAP